MLRLSPTFTHLILALYLCVFTSLATPCCFLYLCTIYLYIALLLSQLINQSTLYVPYLLLDSRISLFWLLLSRSLYFYLFDKESSAEVESLSQEQSYVETSCHGPEILSIDQDGGEYYSSDVSSALIDDTSGDSSERILELLIAEVLQMTKKRNEKKRLSAVVDTIDSGTSQVTEYLFYWSDTVNSICQGVEEGLPIILLHSNPCFSRDFSYSLTQAYPAPTTHSSLSLFILFNISNN